MKKIFMLLFCLFGFLLFSHAKETKYIIKQDELIQLNNFFNLLNGSKWVKKTGWPLIEGEQSAYPYPFGISFKDSIIQNDSLKKVYKLSCSRMYFSNNNLSGSIPNLDLPNLWYMDLSNNQLSGSIPNLYLPKLIELNLSNNQLNGIIPNFNLPKLEKFYLYSNQLSGSIPNLNLPNLYYLNLSSNQLSGTIPDFNLPNLRSLVLSSNQLSGSIPDFNLPNLNELYLSSNQLSGTIPDFNLPNLRSLVLSSNQLSGSIPDFNLPNMNELYLSSNQLSGVIPKLNLSKMNYLYLSNNQLSGTIPNLNLPNLMYLFIDSNKLNGEIPNLNLPNLYILGLSYNQLSGEIPNLNLPKINKLNLANNQLSGIITDFNLPNLEWLNLSENRLCRASLKINLPKITYLYLDHNKLIFKELEQFDDCLYQAEEFNYFNQDTVLPISLSGNTLSVATEGQFNRYHWYKTSESYSSTRENYLTIPANDKEEWYSCEVTNSIFTLNDDLTLKTRPGTKTSIALSEQEYISISPNPAINNITVKYLFNSNKNVNIRIYNSIGEEILKIFGLNEQNIQNIDVSKLPNGAFNIRFEIGDRQIVYPFSVCR